jgi:hypothetical protein
LKVLLVVVVSEAVLLVVVALVAVVVLIGVVILVGGVKLLRLGAISDEVMVSPHSKQPLGDFLLSLWELCKARNFLASKAISSSGCSHTANQKLQPKKTIQTSKQMRQHWWG